MRSGTLLNQFLRVFLPTLGDVGQNLVLLNV